LHGLKSPRSDPGGHPYHNGKSAATPRANDALRTFSFDAKARMLVAGNLVPVALRRDGEITVVPAGLSVFRMGNDGKLEFVRKYDVDTGKLTQWWTGMIALA
jgi:hypothetical protein